MNCQIMQYSLYSYRTKQTSNQNNQKTQNYPLNVLKENDPSRTYDNYKHKLYIYTYIYVYVIYPSEVKE